MQRIDSGAVWWGEPGLVINAAVYGSFTNDTARHFSKHITTMTESVESERLYVVINCEAMTGIGVTPNSAVSNLNYLTNPRVTQVILYGVPLVQAAMTKLLINVLNGAYRTRKIVLVEDKTAAMRVTRQFDTGPLTSTPNPLVDRGNAPHG